MKNIKKKVKKRFNKLINRYLLEKLFSQKLIFFSNLL